MTEAINTHGVTMEFGKHRGELMTRVPASYLKWMVNTGAQQSDLARAEIERRGHKLPTVELSGHAIDNASLRVRKIWHETKRDNEGLYTWLERITVEALAQGERLESGKIKYLGMKLVVEEGEEFPVLKTIMQS
jgi:hypothetical protein